MGQKSSSHGQLASTSSIVGRVSTTLEVASGGAVVQCVCSPDETAVASFTTDNKVLVWDIASGQVVQTLAGHKADVTTCSFAANDLLATGSQDGEVFLWRYRNGKRLSRIAVYQCPIRCCAFSPNGHLLALAAADGRARVYAVRLEAGEFIQGSKYKELIGHTAAVNDVSIADDNKLVVTCSDDASIRTWDASTGTALLRIDGNAGKVLGVRFSPGNDKLVTMCRQSVTIWCAKTGRQHINVPDGNGRGYQCLAVHPSDPIIAIVCMDGSIVIQPLNKNERRAIRHSGHNGPLLSCSFSQQGNIGLTGGIDGKIFVWV